MKKEVVPEVLIERKGLTDQHRKILNAIDSLSPKNYGCLYVPGNPLDRPIPSLAQISRETNIPEKKLIESMKEINDLWGLPSPENLPTNQGICISTGMPYGADEAMIHSLGIQRRLRWDNDMKDYRVTKIHCLDAELGLGTRHANDRALNGERIFRQAMNLNDKLTSVHIQGGIMPEINSFYGKQKHQRTVQIGQSKTGEQASQEEIDLIQYAVKKAGLDITAKDMRNITKEIAGTIDSWQEAARSSAHQLALKLKGIPSWVPVHMYWSYSDDSNLDEQRDVLVQKVRGVMSRSAAATKKLVPLREEYNSLSEEKALLDAERVIVKGLGKYLTKKKVYDVKGQANNALFDSVLERLFIGKGRKPKEGEEIEKLAMESYFDALNQDRTKTREEFFTNWYKTTTHELWKKDATLKSTDKIKAIKEDIDERKVKILQEKTALEDKISEEEQFELALASEKQGGYAWFTKKFAITPTQAKAMDLIAKKDNKSLYTDILIPTLKQVLGNNVNVLLHTDREINVFVPDPEISMKLNGAEPSNDIPLYGDLFGSMPRVNRQRSNEPLMDSFAEMIRKHEGSIATRIKMQTKKPQTYGQFISKDFKRNFAFCNYLFTGHGADGFLHQPKFVVAPTTIDGEFVGEPEIVHYLKLTTRHDVRALSEDMKRGSRGTWDARRLDKGGPTRGIVLFVDHASRNPEPYFVDDKFLEGINDKYGLRISQIESEIAKLQSGFPAAKSKEAKTSIEERLGSLRKEADKVYQEIKPEIKYVLLSNDKHFGSESWPGRPSTTDAVSSSQLVALQEIGFDNLKYSVVTEALHGEQKFKSHDSKRNGWDKDPETFMRNLSFVTKKMKENGASDQKVLETVYELVRQQETSRNIFRSDQQKEMFRLVEQPLFEELMENGIPVFFGAGNHWQASHTEDEANVLASMFDRKYKERGLLQQPLPCNGNSFAIGQILLPSSPGTRIQALVGHKMWHGATEISAFTQQAQRTREDSLYVITADRHHAGMIAQNDKFGILDVGCQPGMMYVSAIGKVTSVRGSVALGYGYNRELMYSARYFLDPVINRVIGWDDRVNVLKPAQSLLRETEKDLSLRHEATKIEQRLPKLKNAIKN